MSPAAHAPIPRCRIGGALVGPGPAALADQRPAAGQVHPLPVDPAPAHVAPLVPGVPWLAEVPHSMNPLGSVASTHSVSPPSARTTPGNAGVRIIPGWPYIADMQ
jgi:hypothetical protein